MTGRKNRFSSLFSGNTQSAKPDSTASTSSPQKLPDYAKRIREAAEAVDKERVDADLDALLNYISLLSDFIKMEEKEKKEKKEKVKKEETEKGNNLTKTKPAKDSLLVSKNFSKLKDALSEAINAAKDFASGDAQTIARGFLKGMGTAHVVNIGFLVVANAWERYEEMSDNQNACLSLLKEMSKFEQHVKELQKRPESKRGMEASIGQAIELIIEASIACCTQIEASKIRRFLSATKSTKRLAELEKKLQQTYDEMQRQMDLCILDAVRLTKPHYPKYPKDAVGIEEPLQEVINKLEWESDKNAVAVILHGFGGMGKTTLADAVFARLFEEKKEGCKFSFVKLFQDMKSTPNVVKLQKSILFDLKGEKAEEIRRYNEGQEEIAVMLEKEEAFIYIDNVLLPDKREQGPDALTQLLPENMGNAKKLRLLITARNKDAASWMTMSKGVEKEFYPIERLPEPKAVELLKKELSDNKNQLNGSQINGIVNICGGVPGLLKVLAGFINGGDGNAVENYKTLMKEAKGKNWKGDIGESIEQYVFAYDKLEDKLKDPFLDICSFFRGWDWKELSDIVGEPELRGLEKRALVTRDVTNMTARVHDVILGVGLQRTEGNRFRLTTATEIEKFLEVEDLQKIKGIWASDNKDPLRIPAKKLDLMSRSLRVLKLGPLTGVEGKCENKFKELRFFSAITSHLPFDVSKLKGFEKLRHLCYNPEDLQNLCQMPSSLRHIKFELNSPSFQISSQCIQQLSNVRVLRLTNAQFKSLPEELGDLGNGLEELLLESCQYLEKLAASFSSLGSLTVLRMSGCSGLTQLPEHLGSLNCLQELSLQRCESLEVLPSELENLTALQNLDLSWCTRLKALPRSLGKLTSLQQLDLSDCTSLEALPSSLKELSSLRLLDLSRCRNIKDLPSGLEKLTSLVELRLFRCYGLSSIPGSIGQLKLNSISLCMAYNLKELPDGFCNFSTLTELRMDSCWRLEKLPERFGEVTSLRKLKLDGCRRLQKLPESFCQLKYLEHLDLSGCSTLEELCKDFKDLSLLRVLSLEYCDKLKKLPEDFQCLTSLEVLDVRDCSKLEGKWIDSMLKMKTLQILRIAGSELLEERWEEIQAQQCNQSWSCSVYTKQGLSNEANLLKQFQSEFVSMLTNGEGKPLNISGRPLNTLLLVMFDGRQDFRPRSFPLPLLEESIDDIQTHFEMVYFGNHWDQLPKKVADRILGHAPANRDTKALFQRLFSSVVQFRQDYKQKVAISFRTSSFQMTAEIVSGENGDKYLSRWKYFEDEREKMEVEDFVVTKRGRYLKLKQVAERGGGSPIALLRELFAGEISVSFLKNKDGESTKVGVDELQGKMIFLDIRPGNNSFDSSLHALVEMYNVEKERFNFEIITVPIMQEDTTLDVSEKFSRGVPWLVLQNPWQLTNTTKYFLIEGCPRGLIQPREWWYPKIMRIIESNGTFAPYNDQSVLRMLHTWGAAAFPFTKEKEEELIQKEKTQMEEAIPHAIFLFQHLERVSEQLREATRQQKMIWLWCCDEKEFPNSMKDVLTELSNIIYIIYIPYILSKETLKYEHFTYTIWHARCPLEPSKMSSAEMERMFSLSLSEYEAIRFWARIRSLKEGIKATDQIQLSELSEMLSIMPSVVIFRGNPSWMFIMNEDGNLITTQGKHIVKLLSEKYEIVKLLSEKYSDDRVKELMQQLLKGTQTSWKKTLLELEEMLQIDGDHNEGYADDDDVDSEGQ